MRNDTRRRLVEAGSRALASRGLDGVRLTAVARDAGVAEGTVYLHFPDREALVSAVVTGAVRELAAVLRQIRSRPSAIEAADLLAVEAIVTWAESHRDLFLGAIRGSWSLAGAEAVGELLAQREAELRSFQAAGEVNPDLDPQVVARAEFATYCHTLSWWLVEEPRVSRQRLVETLARLLRHGTAITSP